MSVGFRKRGAQTLAALFVLFFATTAGAIEPHEPLRDPALEARARALFAELRCLVCENESIEASRAPLAADLRALVRERLVAGDDERAIKTLLRDRYGDYVLLRPVFSWMTAALWLGPFLVGLTALLALMLRRRRAAGPPPANDLSADEIAELELLMNDGPERRGRP